MTQNQINFRRAVEEERHNRVMEGQGYSSLLENARHNQQSEAVGWYTGQTGRILAEPQVDWYKAQTEHRQQETLYYPIVVGGNVRNNVGALIGAGVAGLNWIYDAAEDLNNFGFYSGHQFDAGDKAPEITQKSYIY